MMIMRIILKMVITLSLLLPSCVAACTFTWIPPTQNTDGTPLTNLDKYIIYYKAPQRHNAAEITPTGGISATQNRHTFILNNRICKVGTYWIKDENTFGIFSENSLPFVKK